MVQCMSTVTEWDEAAREVTSTGARWVIRMGNAEGLSEVETAWLGAGPRRRHAAR